MPQNDPVDLNSLEGWGLGRAHVLDDRGQRVRLVTATEARSRGVDAAAAKAIRAAAWRGIPVESWAILGLMAALQTVIVFRAVRGIGYARTSKYAQPDDWMYPAFMIPCAVVMVALTWSGMRRKHAGSLAEAYLRVGVCGSCGYALAGLNPASDGCVACPECGAAWRMGKTNAARTVERPSEQGG